MKPEDLFTIVCRPALPKDTFEVIKFTQEIWEGEDYVPHVWENWLKDFQSFLAIAEYSGHVVGIGRITQLSSEEWWLEGLRVHPQYQGRGIASHIHHYILDYWERNLGCTVRLGTASTRYQVHHLCKQNRFTKITEFTLYKASTLNQEITAYTPMIPDDVSEALELILESPFNQINQGLMDHGWKWSRLSALYLRKAITQNKAWWWRGRQGLVIYRDESEGKRRYPLIQLLACPWESLEDCLLDYRRKGAVSGHESVGWLAPLHSELHLVLTAAGFERTWDDSLIIFEKKHTQIS
jgi:GNAT superfamily N-acetyltransferase